MAPYNQKGFKGGGGDATRGPPVHKVESLPQRVSKLKAELLALVKDDPRFIRNLCAETREDRVARERDLLRKELEELKKVKNGGSSGGSSSAPTELSLSSSDDKETLESAISTIKEWIAQKGQ